MKVKRETKKGIFKKIDDTEAKILVLLVDTEGCINAAFEKKYAYYHPNVSIGMGSELPVLYWQKWGGFICRCASSKRFPAKGLYQWGILKYTDVRAFLFKIVPYLQLKKKQAEIALEMLDILAAKTKGWKERTKVLAAEIRRLNHQPLPNIDLQKLAHGTIMKR